MKTPTNEQRIAAVNRAARSVGMSYGRYVVLTGGPETPPDWLVRRTRPDAKHCPRCGRVFVASSPRQIYCTAHCRKAAYDERQSATTGGG